MMQKGEKGIGFGLPPLDDLGIDPTPAFPQASQGFFGLLPGLGSINPLEILSQHLPVLPPRFIERILCRMENAELPVRFGKDLLDRLL
jgi:hypothetical protein